MLQLRQELRTAAMEKNGGIAAAPDEWLPELRRRLCTDKALKTRILDETLSLGNQSNDNGNFGITLPSNYGDAQDNAGNLNGTIGSPGALARMFITQAHHIFKWDETYEPSREESAHHVAMKQGRVPMEVLYDWMCEDDGRRVATLLFMNYNTDSSADTLEMLGFEGTIPGLGDAGAHLGFLCDMTASTYLLTYYHRDRKRGPRLPLETVVKLHSADCADAFTLSDRGRLLEGKLADINVIDLPNLHIHCPRMVHDLPEKASRWIQTCEGYDYTIKSGVITQHNGLPTGALPGGLLRGQAYHAKKQAVPSSKDSWGQWLSEVRWEAEQMGLEAAVSLVGPSRLEKFGDWMAERSFLKSRL